MSHIGCGHNPSDETPAIGAVGDLVVDRIRPTAVLEIVRDKDFGGVTPLVEPTQVDSSRQALPGRMTTGIATATVPVLTMNPPAEEGTGLTLMTAIHQIMITRHW
jgi:hypothetical protein